MARADYEVVKITDDVVFIQDLNQGRMTVTNDAETVVREVNALHPRRRIVYKDSLGEWDEIFHDDGVFRGFGPWARGVAFP